MFKSKSERLLVYSSFNQATLPGYAYINTPCPEGRGGGGTAVIYRKNNKITTISLPHLHSIEFTVFKLSGPNPLVIAIICRISKPNTSFLSDFTDFLTQLCASSPNVLLCDFNLHIDNPDSKSAADFLDLLNCFTVI